MLQHTNWGVRSIIASAMWDCSGCWLSTAITFSTIPLTIWSGKCGNAVPRSKEKKLRAQPEHKSDVPRDTSTKKHT